MDHKKYLDLDPLGSSNPPTEWLWETPAKGDYISVSQEGTRKRFVVVGIMHLISGTVCRTSIMCDPA